MNPQQPTLRLRRRLHLLNASYNGWLLALCAAFVLLPLAITGLLVWLVAGADLAEACRKFLAEALEGAGRDPVFLAVLAALPISLLWTYYFLRHERLVIDEQGLEYRSSLRGPFGFLHALNPGWRIEWADIEAVSIREGGARPQTLPWWRVEITPRSGKPVKLAPYSWYERPDESGLRPSQLTRADAETCRAAVERSPLYRELAARELIHQQSDVKRAEPGFDLTGHTGLLIAVAGFFLLGGLAVLDTFFVSSWQYAEWPPAGPFVLVFALALLLGITLGRGAPARERFTVAVLLAAAAAAVVHPALLRYNAATDPDGPAGYRYRQVAVGEFEPVDRPGMPALHFDDYMEFWRSMPTGTEREFVMARGRMGFWQLDIAPIRRDMRGFFGSRRPGE